MLDSTFGTACVARLPIAVHFFMETVGTYFVEGAYPVLATAQMRLILFGGLIMFFLVGEPDVLNGLWHNIRNYFRVWPFSY